MAMEPVNVTITRGTSDRNITVTVSPAVIGNQYDRAARKFVFTRPVEFYNDDLVVYMKTKGVVEPVNIGMLNELPIFSLLTQRAEMDFQVAFERDGTELALSNVVTLQFRESLKAAQKPVDDWPAAIGGLQGAAFCAALDDTAEKMIRFFNLQGEEVFSIQLPEGRAAAITEVSAVPLPAGSAPTVTMGGTDQARTFEFGIPPGRDGESGSPGEAGAITAVSAVPLPAGSAPTVTMGGTDQARTFEFGVPAGRDGTSVRILGSYESLAQLRAEHPAGETGDGYLIAGYLYAWIEDDRDWVNVGEIKGPKGDKGDPGGGILTQAQKDLVTAAARRHANHVRPDVLCLGFVTDTHACDGGTFDSSADGIGSRSMTRTLINYAQLALAAQSTTLHGIVLCGDNQDGGQTDGGRTRWTPEQASEAWARMSAGFAGSPAPVFAVRGNHDDNTDGNSQLAHYTSPTAQWQWFNATFDARNGAVHDTQQLDSLYYYRDFDAQKIRCIFLNSIDYPVIINGANLKYWGDSGTTGYGMQARQLTWLHSEALNFAGKSAPAEWDVLVFAHCREHCGACNNHKNAEFAMGILDAFNRRTTYSYNGTATDWLASGSCDFTTVHGGKVLGFLQGHEHQDFTLAPGATSTTTWRENLWSFQISGFSAGFASKDGCCFLLAVDKAAKSIYVTKICPLATVVDRAIPIADANPFVPEIALTQGTITTSGVEVTVTGNRIKLNGTVTTVDRQCKVTNGLAGLTTIPASQGAAASDTLIALTPGEYIRVEMKNISGTISETGQYTNHVLPRVWCNQASGTPHWNVAGSPTCASPSPAAQLIPAGTTKISHIGIALGSSNWPMPTYTGPFEFELEIYVGPMDDMRRVL